MDVSAASDFIGSGIYFSLKEVMLMKTINFVQIYKENEELCKVARELGVPYFEELNAHEGIIESNEIILDAINKRIAIQGKRNDMHFEIAFQNNVAIGIAMFAIDLGTVRGLLDSGYGTVMEFYIRPEYRRMDFGKEFWRHIEDVLCEDGASNCYVTPNSVTGIPFWTAMGFADSGLADPDSKQPIYTKVISK